MFDKSHEKKGNWVSRCENDFWPHRICLGYSIGCHLVIHFSQKTGLPPRFSRNLNNEPRPLLKNKTVSEQEFVRLLVEHQAALRAYVLAQLPGSPEADDVIQDVNLVLWEKKSEFIPGTNFRSWLFSIARFKVLAVWRDKKRNREWGLPRETLEKIMDEGQAEAFENIGTHQSHLRECLEQLKSGDRDLILRRYINEKRIRSLAGSLRRSEESVKVSLHRIRLTLRACVLSKISVENVMT